MTEDEARQRVILSMCPARVCRTCGEPSRRISEAGSPSLSGKVLQEAREALGLSRAEVGAWFGGGANNVWDYEVGGHIPPRERWELLKAGLKIGDEYDYLIPDREEVTYTPQSGPGKGTGHLPPKVNPAGRGFEWHEATRTGTVRFTDCGHDNWREGVWLDPFAT